MYVLLHIIIFKTESRQDKIGLYIMKSFSIITPEQFSTIATPNGNGISVWVLNSRDLYFRLESLCNCCKKQFNKFGGLDYLYLVNSSTLKAITRDARKQLANMGEYYRMQDDMTARVYLAYYVFEWCIYG